MIKKLVFILASTLVILFTCGSCTHSTSDNDNPTVDTTHTDPPVSGSICFETDILPIFISNCAMSGCHDANTAAEGFVFTSYTTITSKDFKPGDPEETELYEAITESDLDERMPLAPASPLSAAQIQLIRQWILDGAPNTTNCSGSGCDTSDVKFSSTISPIINNNCKGCHNSTSPGGGYSFDSHAGVKAAVDANRLLGSIRHQNGYSSMPQGGTKLSGCQIRQFEIWVAAGAPNN